MVESIERLFKILNRAIRFEEYKLPSSHGGSDGEDAPERDSRKGTASQHIGEWERRELSVIRFHL
jgi:hypothetical protein